MKKDVTVYVATLRGETLGIFSNPHLVTTSNKITHGFGVRSVETVWGWAIETREGVVEVRPVQLDPK